MKQILSAAAIFLMSLSSTRSSAQNNPDVSLILSGITATGAFSPNSIEANSTEVNVRAMRDFSRTYKSASQAKWYKSTTGYFATFNENGTNTKIIYDTRGRRLYTILSFPAAKLDRNVRSAVMSTYYESTIIGAHRFEFENKTVYVVKMLDGASHPFTLKVCDGRIEDITSK